MNAILITPSARCQVRGGVLHVNVSADNTDRLVTTPARPADASTAVLRVLRALGLRPVGDGTLAGLERGRQVLVPLEPVRARSPRAERHRRRTMRLALPVGAFGR